MLRSICKAPSGCHKAIVAVIPASPDITGKHKYGSHNGFKKSFLWKRKNPRASHSEFGITCKRLHHFTEGTGIENNVILRAYYQIGRNHVEHLLVFLHLGSGNVVPKYLDAQFRKPGFRFLGKRNGVRSDKNAKIVRILGSADAPRGLNE